MGKGKQVWGRATIVAPRDERDDRRRGAGVDWFGANPMTSHDLPGRGVPPPYTIDLRGIKVPEVLPTRREVEVGGRTVQIRTLGYV